MAVNLRLPVREVVAGRLDHGLLFRDSPYAYWAVERGVERRGLKGGAKPSIFTGVTERPHTRTQPTPRGASGPGHSRRSGARRSRPFDHRPTFRFLAWASPDQRLRHPGGISAFATRTISLRSVGFARVLREHLPRSPLGPTVAPSHAPTGLIASHPPATPWPTRRARRLTPTPLRRRPPSDAARGPMSST